MTEPTFTNQRFHQLREIEKELKLFWNHENREHILNNYSRTDKFNVYIVGWYMYASPYEKKL